MKVEGYFKTLKRANDTLVKLKEAGFENCYVDGNDHYTGSDGGGTNLAGTETGISLAALTLNSGGDVMDDRSKAPLLAASPMASGMGGFEEIADLNCKVVVECEEAGKAREIIKSMEGELDSPNINARKHVKDLNPENIRLGNRLL